MLNRLVGPQGTAALVIYGESLDGEDAVRRGLAWSCVEDDSLLDEACRLAAHAATVPQALTRRLKATMRSTAAIDEHHDAVELELDAQLWSVEQPEFRRRLGALRTRITGGKKR